VGIDFSYLRMRMNATTPSCRARTSIVVNAPKMGSRWRSSWTADQSAG